PAVISPDRGLHGLLVIAPAGITAVRLDAAFPVLHGKNERPKAFFDRGMHDGQGSILAEKSPCPS
ncbi:hypothetical protein NE547_17245, partial [Flavonifractor sp. DFI.6.63]|nr:hypothetical protein [Flavonifractor sp. DFI.6.63]